MATTPVALTGSSMTIPAGRVTIAGMALETMGQQRDPTPPYALNPKPYWAMQRMAFLSGYDVKWVVPGRSGSGTTTSSVLSLDPSVVMVPEIYPARTMRFTLDPFVINQGQVHAEPKFTTILSVVPHVGFGLIKDRPVVIPPPKTAPMLLLAPNPLAPDEDDYSDLGETARWYPSATSYGVTEAGRWNPWNPVTGADSAVRWHGLSGDAPTLNPSFTFAGYSLDTSTPSLEIGPLSSIRLDGLDATNRQLTLIFVASLVTSPQRWLDLLSAVRSDWSQSMNGDQITLRLLPDGMLHLWATGWMGSVPLANDHHRAVLFGLSMDADGQGVRMFAMNRQFQMMRTRLRAPHLTSTVWHLGLAGVDAQPLDVLDVLMYRSVLSDDDLEWIAGQMDARYGITTPELQE